LSSVLWHCWLGGRKGVPPVKNWVMGCWHGYSIWGEVQRCIRRSWCHCHPLSFAPVNPDWVYLIGFNFLVPAHPDSPKQSRGHKMVVIVVVNFIANLIYNILCFCLWEIIKLIVYFAWILVTIIASCLPCSFCSQIIIPSSLEVSLVLSRSGFGFKW